MSNTKTLSAFLAGAAAGAVAAILLAPASGRETRQYILGAASKADNNKEATDKARSAADNFTESGLQENQPANAFGNTTDAERW